MNNKPPDQPKVGVGLIVIKNGKYILMHRRKSKLGTGYWGTGGGHLELGESLLEGALREFHEEAGKQIVIGKPRFIGVCNFTDFYPHHYVDVSFVAEWISGEPHENAPDAVELWQWFPLSKLPEPVLPTVLQNLDMLKEGHMFADSKHTID